MTRFAQCLREGSAHSTLWNFVNINELTSCNTLAGAWAGGIRYLWSKFFTRIITNKFISKNT